MTIMVSGGNIIIMSACSVCSLVFMSSHSLINAIDSIISDRKYIAIRVIVTVSILLFIFANICKNIEKSKLWFSFLLLINYL